MVGIAIGGKTFGCCHELTSESPMFEKRNSVLFVKRFYPRRLLYGLGLGLGSLMRRVEALVAAVPGLKLSVSKNLTLLFPGVARPFCP